MFSHEYHQNEGFSMAMLVYPSVYFYMYCICIDIYNAYNISPTCVSTKRKIIIFHQPIFLQSSHSWADTSTYTSTQLGAPIFGDISLPSRVALGMKHASSHVVI